MLNNLLFYRFLILNVFILIAFIAAYQQGWLIAFIENDKSYISLAIIISFIIAWLYQSYKSFIISRRINAFKHAVKNNLLDNYKTYNLPINKLLILRDKDLTKISWMKNVAGWLIVMGLLGTVIGFIIALSGVPEATLSGQEGVEGIQNSVGILVRGMYVALYTTLAGGIAGLIIELNASMIHTALYNHWADFITKLGKQ